MVSHLFIVSRHQPDLYGYLSREFAQEEDVQVILDRRVGDRRRGTGPPPAGVERRGRDRRTRAEVKEDLASLGYAFVRLD